jgi:phage shock protein C
MREPLYRSRADRFVLGVAGGVAEWLDVDSAVVRLVWVLLFLAGGAGFLLYIVAAIVIPEEPLELADTQAPPATVDPAAPAGAPTAATAAMPATRREARQARRAARQAAHGERDGSIAVGLGIVLVLVGALLLIRNVLPDLDMNLVGPAILIVIGLVLVVSALGRRPKPPAG